VKALVEASLAASDPTPAVGRFLRRNDNRLWVGQREYDLSSGRVFIVSAGKAATPMGAAAARILGDWLAEGILVSKREHPTRQVYGEVDQHDRLDARLRQRYAGHPVPDKDGVAATAEVVEMLGQTTPDDLVLCLVSGGASALLTQPVLPLEQWQRLVDALLASGCTINELNAVRKRMDLVKGGGLARLAAPANVASLILSDVVGNPLDVIGSGPTVANPDDPELAAQILERYGVSGQLTAVDWARIKRHLAQLSARGPADLEDVNNTVIGDVRSAARGAAATATKLGFQAHILTAHLEGEAREVGRVAGALAKDAAPSTCLILGGETTVTLKGDGIGGRNLEVALAAAMAIDGWPDRVVVTLATDGDDGPTGAAGATVTGETLSHARRLGLDAAQYLDDNDSYPFLKATGSLLITGQTGTNVNDLLFILRYGQ